MGEWKRVRIGQFLRERAGRYDPKDESVLGLKRLNKIDFSGEIHLSDKGSKTDMIVVEPGDLIISGINVSKGALAVYHGDEPITATIHYSSYIFDEKQIDIEYFKRFVRSQSFIQALKDQVKGGIKTEIKSKHFLPLEIDLPDIEIQKDIVSFFKRVEGDMDELGSEISSQIKYLNKFRQAMLQEAIEGKLTAEWRKQNPELIGGENHASKLLEKIKAEKERLIKEGKIKKEKPLSPIADEEKPFALPEGWVWCRLADIFETENGDRSSNYPVESDFVSSGIPFINTKNLVDGQVDLSLENTVYISSRKFESLRSGKLKDNDLLMVLRGSVGKSGIFKATGDVKTGFINAQLMILRGFEVDSDFYNLLLKTRFFLEQAIQRSSGSAQPQISAGNLIKCIIVVPPLSEQRAVVERVNLLMRMVSELKQQVTNRKEQSELLMQSVLREAFEYSHA